MVLHGGQCFKGLSSNVEDRLKSVGLGYLKPQLATLGVCNLKDLQLVDDSDLVRWGLSTVERRLFFRCVSSQESVSGGTAMGSSTGGTAAKADLQQLAERVLATWGPLTLPELAIKLTAVAPPPSLAEECGEQGTSGPQWRLLVEARVRSCRRLRLEEGLLEGGDVLVSIRSSILFSCSSEVIADSACWGRVALFLSSPGQVAHLGSLCRSSREVSDGASVWERLLSRWYPKATVLNPDWEMQAKLERSLESAIDNDYTKAALLNRLKPDMPYALEDLIAALPQPTTPRALIKFMSSHPQNFRQDDLTGKFCVCRDPEQLLRCIDWKQINPYCAASAAQFLGSESAGTRVLTESSVNFPVMCKELDAKQTFRLYHTGLLMQRSEQSKRGKLEAWEYYTESNSKCVLAPGDLLDLAESRVCSIRQNDPAVVHELVAQTLEGMVRKIPFGYWNRRVRILTFALNASQLRVGREQRKKIERRLDEFMEWVKHERGFGFYQCAKCGGRWKSGFSYEEIAQSCLQCDMPTKPYRIRDLEAPQDGSTQSLRSGKKSRRGLVRDRVREVPIESSMEVAPPRSRQHKRSLSLTSDSFLDWDVEDREQQRQRLRIDAAAASRIVRHHAGRAFQPSLSAKTQISALPSAEALGLSAEEAHAMGL